MAVVLIHAAAISVLLSVREVLLRSTSPSRPEPVTYWIRLPEIAAEPAVRSSPAQRGLPMLPIFGGTGELGAPVFSTPAVTAFTALPSLILPPGSTALTAAGDYFACNFVDYDKITDAERLRCAAALSNIGPVTGAGSEYADVVGTPFRLFGARGRLTITAAKQPSYASLPGSAGCDWLLRACQPPPSEFGIDPDDPRRGSVLAEFNLGSGFTLFAGAQGYMEDYLGGGRLAATSGIRVIYRW